jgi:hypothetical protein
MLKLRDAILAEFVTVPGPVTLLHFFPGPTMLRKFP